MARVKCAFCLKAGPERSNPLDAVEAAVAAGYTSVRFPYEEDRRRMCSPFFCSYCGRYLRTHFLTTEAEVAIPAEAVLVPLDADAAFEDDTGW